MAALVLTVGQGAIRAQGPSVSLPPQAAAVDVDGEIEAIVEDSNSGSRLLHFLRTRETRYQLEFGGDKAPDVQTGTKVRAHGRLQNNTLDLSSKNGGSMQVQALASSSTFGAQSVIVLLVNFQDNTSVSTDAGSAFTTTFQTTSDFFRENSYGQTWLTGEVKGPYTLPMSASGCDYNSIASLADQAASSDGVNLNSYSRRVYAFPSNGCGWWGLGTVGGNPSRAWINGSYALKVVSHELGHNFGDHHSHSQPCDVNGCSQLEYGDDHDDMGQTSIGHFNAFQKERLGWLNYGSSPAIQSVSASGTYWIDGYETAGSGPKALKVLKSSGMYYYIEVRSQVGFDSWDSPGVLVHTGVPGDGTTSNQFDLDAVTGGFDSILDVGQTFIDVNTGFSITPISAGPAGASLMVTYSGPPCVPASPTVSLSPGGTVLTAPGQQINYNVSVRNNDSSTCATATFDLGSSVPVGWQNSFNLSNLNVAPGSTGNASLWVMPSPDATGISSVTALATRGSGGNGSASSNVQVASSLNVSLSMWSVKGGFQAAATVGAGSVPISGAIVTFTVTNPSGGLSTLSATTNANGVATVKVSVKGRNGQGTYQVTATASGNGLTGTASGSFTVSG